MLTAMLILGIESSCDETAVALVRDGHEIVASLVASQIELHQPYGGIVPEVACRAHSEWLPALLDQIQRESGLALRDVDGIAGTAEPGLIGALLVGLTSAKSLAWAYGKPFVGVNHIDGHIHATRMRHREMPFPHLSLVVSGGHTEIYLSESAVKKTLVAQTMDDAAGECFDKVAALLGLGYPGGPRIQQISEGGDRKAVRFPRGKSGDDGMQLSFSGLKTAVLYYLRDHGFEIQGGRPRVAAMEARKADETLTVPMENTLADIAASFQEAAVDMLIRAVMGSVRATGVRHVGLTGGVAANTRLRAKLRAAGEKGRFEVYLCPRELCTDNAAFIAGMGYELIRAGMVDTLERDAVPN